MASLRKHRGSVQVEVSTYVDIDVDEVLEEISTDDLRDELERREGKSRGPDGPAGGSDLNLRLQSWEADKLRDAVRNDDGRRAVDLLKEYLA